MRQITVFSSRRTCSSTPSSRNSSRTSLITSSITDLYNLGYDDKTEQVHNLLVLVSTYLNVYNKCRKTLIKEVSSLNGNVLCIWIDYPPHIIICTDPFVSRTKRVPRDRAARAGNCHGQHSGFYAEREAGHRMSVSLLSSPSAPALFKAQSAVYVKNRWRSVV